MTDDFCSGQKTAPIAANNPNDRDFELTIEKTEGSGVLYGPQMITKGGITVMALPASNFTGGTHTILGDC